eukprot:IDg20697t1
MELYQKSDIRFQLQLELFDAILMAIHLIDIDDASTRVYCYKPLASRVAVKGIEAHVLREATPIAGAAKIFCVSEASRSGAMAIASAACDKREYMLAEDGGIDMGIQGNKLEIAH